MRKRARESPCGLLAIIVCIAALLLVPVKAIIISTEAMNARSVVAADFDNDGLADVLSGSNGDDTLAWYKNEGNGRFSDPHIITTNADAVLCVYAADLNNDGLVDALSASYSDSKIAWYKNRGNGNFSSQIIISSNAAGAQHVVAADLNNDGHLDVVSASKEDDKIAWYLNFGNGTFSSERIISTNAVLATSVVAADLNSDGLVDVISGSSGDHKAAWYMNLGEGEFSDEHIITTSAYYTRWVDVGDLNNDGYIDVITTSPSPFSDEIRWFVNDGSGRFLTQHLLTSAVRAVQSTYVKDINHDGLLDVLCASYGDDKILWFMNGGDGHFYENVIASDTDGAESVFAVDLTNDGWIDVLSASNLDDKIAWYPNVGEVLSWSDTVISQVSRVETIQVADLNNDGLLDVLTVSFQDGKVGWFRNDGTSGFSEFLVISRVKYSGPKSVFAADFDGDGWNDVVSASEYNDRVAWHRNNGDGTFSSQLIISSNAKGAYSVFAADLDNDGLPDVLSASRDDNKIAWYRNEGDGTFSSEGIISNTAGLAYSVFAADINNDGLADVLTASWGDSKIAYHMNMGNGMFTAEVIITISLYGACFVTATDLNNDGWLDVLASACQGNTVSWYPNMGNGKFSEERVISSTISTPIAMTAADVNRDGYLDVVVASNHPSDPSTMWFMNLGGGEFSAGEAVHKGGGYAVVASDVNNDGFVDILSGGFSLLHILTIDARNVFISHLASDNSCTDSDLCATPPSRKQSGWQVNTFVDNVTITQPWIFPPGPPVTLTGPQRGEHPIVECSTGTTPCIQFHTMKWATILHLTITGSSSVLFDIRSVGLLQIGHVNMYMDAPSPHYKTLTGPRLLMKGLYAFPTTAKLFNVTIRDSVHDGAALDAAVIQQLNLHSCQFSNISNVEGNGGAIHASNLQHLQIEATSFHHCSASQSGGAIAVVHTTLVDVKHSEFSACSANSHGGAMWGKGNAWMLMTNTTTVSCHSMQGEGGGMYIDMEREEGFTLLHISNTSWVKNTARHGCGGAMAIVDGSSQSPDEPYAFIENSELEGNEASDGGGLCGSVAAKYKYSEDSAVQVRGTLSELKLHNVTFARNLAKERGGGVHTTGASVRVVHCIAKLNTASLQGGFLWSIRGSLVMSETQVWHNAVILQDAGPIALNGGHSVGGGGLFLADCQEVQAVLYANEIWNNSVTANVVALGGGIYAANCMANIQHAVFSLNTVRGQVPYMNASILSSGGAVALHQFAELKCSNSSFTWNQVPGRGGAIVCLGCKALQLEKSTVTSNQGKRGGGIYVQDVVEHAMVNVVNISMNLADEGGGLVTSNSYMGVRDSHCYDNVAVAPAHGTSRGGCACIMSGSTASYTDTIFTNNHAGLGGSVYVQCGTTFEFFNSSFSEQWASSPERIIGRGMYSECTAPDYATMSALQRTSGAVKGVIVAAASSVFESISTTSPVLIVHTHSQNGRICTEDNATTCSLQATSEDSPVSLLSPSAFNASQGVITIAPFLFQGLNVKSVHLRLECQGFESFFVEHVVPVTLPIVRWNKESAVGVPSDSSQPVFLDPAPQVNLTNSLGHLVSLSGAICFVSLHQSLQNGTDGEVAMRLLGQTSAIPESGVAKFPSLGLDAPFGSTFDLQCTCQLRSGTEVFTTFPLVVDVVAANLSWSRFPSQQILTTDPLAPFQLHGGTIRGSLNPPLVMAREIPCSLELRGNTAGLQTAFEFRQPIQFTLLFNDSPNMVSSFELLPRLPPASSDDSVLLRVQCLWINRQAITSEPVHLQPAKFNVELLLRKPVYRLDFTPLSINVHLSTKGGIPTSFDEHPDVEVWYLPSMTCSLSALLDNGNPSAQILDHIDNNLVLRPKYNASVNYATASTSIRINAAGGRVVNIAASCQANGLSIGSTMTSANISAVGASWHSHHTEWFPASGDYQTVLQNPYPSIAFHENGRPVNSTEGYTCYVAINNSARFTSTSQLQNESATPSLSAAVLLSPPAGGYRGATDTHVVQLDRIILQAPFLSQVTLSVTCVRELEPFQALYATVFMREPLIHAVEPLNSVSLYPRDLFQVRALVEPDDTLTRAHANIQCALEAPDVEMRGASAMAFNGTVTFESVLLLGVVGSRYNLSMVCQLGNRQLSSVPTFVVIIESCPGGTEPSDDKTACLPCADDAYSDGGGQPCRKCPEVGVACSSGILRIQPGYYPFDTRLLQGLQSPGTDHAHILPSTVFYPCWNDEACSMNSTTRGISCSKGYGGPLCGFCDARAGYVSAGSNCIPCWPSAVNAVILTLGGFVALFLLTYVASFQRVKGTSSSKIVLRIGVTYVQMLASLGLFRAQATETFRAILGVAEGVGASLAASPPVQCTFHFGFYTRFLLDLGLPVFVVPVTIACAVCVLAVKAIKASRRHRNALNFQHRSSLDSSNGLFMKGALRLRVSNNRTFRQGSEGFGASKSQLVTDTALGGELAGIKDRSITKGTRFRAAAGESTASLWSVAWRIRLQSEQVGSNGGNLAAKPKRTEGGGATKSDHQTVSPAENDPERLVGSCTSIFAKLLRQYWKQKLFLAPSIFIVFFFYNSVSATIATMFRCRAEEIDGKRYLAADLGTECYSPGHVVGMVVTAIVALVFNIGFPLVLFWFLRKNAARLTDKKVFMRFGFLYQGYSISRSMWGWEVLVLLRKFAVVVAASAIDDPWYQSMAGIGIVFTSLCLQLRYRPYESNRFNRLEEYVLATVVCTQVLTLLYLRSEVTVMSNTERQHADLAVTVALLLMNGATSVVLVTMWWHGWQRGRTRVTTTGKPVKVKLRDTVFASKGVFMEEAKFGAIKEEFDNPMLGRVLQSSKDDANSHST